MSKIKTQANADLSLIESQLRKDKKFSQGNTFVRCLSDCIRQGCQFESILFDLLQVNILGFTAAIQKASKVFEDETSLSNTVMVSYIWSKRGKTASNMSASAQKVMAYPLLAVSALISKN